LVEPVDQSIGPKSEPAESRGPDVGDEDIGRSDQREGRLEPVWGVEFENNTPLAPIVEFKYGIDIQVTAQHVDELAGWIPFG
jgi:hypothetical protein